MSSDDARHVPDPGWRPAGVGIVPTFRCARCDRPREVSGRKLQRVMGLRTWVCKGCAK